MRPQNHQRRGRRGGHSRRSRSPVSKQAPERPKTFWQKIVAFLGGGVLFRKAAGSARAASIAGRPEPERKVRKPERVEVTSPKLYVGNLSFEATESDLFELFKGVGSVQNAEIVTHKHTMKSKGFGFVTMQSIEEARRAVEVLHDRDFMGRKLVVSGAKTTEVRSTSHYAGAQAA